MSPCKRIKNCTFFIKEMKTMPITAEYIKKDFCEDDYSNCARNYLFAWLEKKGLSLDDKTDDSIAKLSDSLYPHELNKVKKALRDSHS